MEADAYVPPGWVQIWTVFLRAVVISPVSGVGFGLLSGDDAAQYHAVYILPPNRQKHPVHSTWQPGCVLIVSVF